MKRYKIVTADNYDLEPDDDGYLVMLDDALAAIAKEREACAAVVESFQHWIGENGKRELACAIRNRIDRLNDPHKNY